MPPRGVTAAMASADCVRSTGSSRIAREFGDGAERAQTPLCIGIGNFPLQQVDHRDSRGHLAWWDGLTHESAFSLSLAGQENTVLSGQDKPVRK